jgi:hypothetical protein
MVKMTVCAADVGTAGIKCCTRTHRWDTQQKARRCVFSASLAIKQHIEIPMKQPNQKFTSNAVKSYEQKH